MKITRSGGSYGTDDQRNRERKTKGQKVQIGRRWRVVSSRPAVGWEALALAVSVRWTEKNMTFGEYPLITLKDAHDLHFAAKKLLATGVNPMAARKAEAEAKQQEAKAIQREVDSSFEKIAERWWGMVVDRQVATSCGYPYGAPGTNVFPVIGWMSIDAAQTAHIRDIMLTIETRGAGDVAKRAHQSIGQIFRFAIAREIECRMCMSSSCCNRSDQTPCNETA
jgi:hypothetical protein